MRLLRNIQMYSSRSAVMFFAEGEQQTLLLIRCQTTGPSLLCSLKIIQSHAGQVPDDGVCEIQSPVTPSCHRISHFQIKVRPSLWRRPMPVRGAFPQEQIHRSRQTPEFIPARRFRIKATQGQFRRSAERQRTRSLQLPDLE